jgi:hypothetical protein
MVYLDLRKWIYISISNPKKTMNKVREVFKPLKCKFKFRVNNWYPVLWCSKPAYIQIMSYDVQWKDKYDTPRYEYPPAIWIHLFKWNFIWYWTIEHDEQYWEQALWYLYYSGTITQELGKVPNIEIARKNWPWIGMDGNSTWEDKYLKDEIVFRINKK